MKIGELAATTGFPPKTIRYYESEGLLGLPERTEAGYRTYGQIDRERLLFVRKAKRLGLSLAEIRSVLQLYDRQEPTCVHVKSLLDAKLAQVEAAINELADLRRTLLQLRQSAGTLEDCRPAGGRICGIVEGTRLNDTFPGGARAATASGAILKDKSRKRRTR